MLPLNNISGLCIKDDCIYSTCQVDTVNLVRKLRVEDGQEEVTASNIPLFRGVGKLRGISFNENFYVVDRGENRILKYNESWEPLRKTCSKRFLNDPFGIYVNNNWIFLCDSKNHCVRVLDRELDHKFSIPHITEPMNITFFKQKFFVTSRELKIGLIVILDIDFCNQRYSRCDIELATSKTIRGICGKDEYLYVTERDGRILCLKYETLCNIHCLQLYKLDHVYELTRNAPVDIVCDNKNIYYSGKSNDNRCFVAQLDHNKTTGKLTTREIYS